MKELTKNRVNNRKIQKMILVKDFTKTLILRVKLMYNAQKIQILILVKDFIKPLILRQRLNYNALKNNKMKMMFNKRNKI